MGEGGPLEKQVRQRLIDEHAQRLYQAACAQPGACERLEGIYGSYLRAKGAWMADAVDADLPGDLQAFLGFDSYDFCQELARLDFWRPSDIIGNVQFMPGNRKAGVAGKDVVLAHRHLIARARAHDELVRVHTNLADKVDVTSSFNAYGRFVSQRSAFKTPENMRTLVYARFTVRPPMRFEWLLLNEHFQGGEDSFMLSLYQEAYEPLIASFHVRPSVDSMTMVTDRMFTDLRFEQLGITPAHKRKK